MSKKVYEVHTSKINLFISKSKKEIKEFMNCKKIILRKDLKVEEFKNIAFEL